MRRTTSYDVLNVKTGPTSASVDFLNNGEKRSKLLKVLVVYFTYVGQKPLGGLTPNFFMVVDIRDIITCFKFGDDRFRGLASAEGQILLFPIDFDGRPYNTLTLWVLRFAPLYRIIEKKL